MSLNARDAAFHDLTQYEIEALSSPYNLADAHARQRPSPAEQRVIDDLPALWERSLGAAQADVDEELLRAFFSFHGQPTAAAEPGRSLISYAASVAMTIVATYLRLHRASVTLIEPCFDNLHEILVQNELLVRPIDEAVVFRSPDVYEALAGQDVGDALILVDPNNPTGSTSFVDDGSRFERIVDFCAAHGKILVLDFSFASFLVCGGADRPDVYRILERSGVTYMTIEDTGKTWPTLDLKCGILTASRDIRQQVRDLHTGVLLNVSPFALQLITRFVETSAGEGFASISGLLDENRRTLVRELRGSTLEYLPPMVPVSVAWFRLRGGGAAELQGRLAAEGVHVLPGGHFFWSDHERGQSHLRIALARDRADFARSIKALRSATVPQ